MRVCYIYIYICIDRERERDTHIYRRGQQPPPTQPGPRRLGALRGSIARDPVK